MVIKVKRFKSNGDATAGRFYVNGVYMCDSLEDEKRTVKVKGETRIPSGSYKVILRTEGTTHEKYLKRFPDFHKGMLWLQDVPNFEYILIHIGNTEKDTEGCILIGSLVESHDGSLTLIDSTSAYKKIYPMIAAALERGGNVTIEVEDEQ